MQPMRRVLLHGLATTAWHRAGSVCCCIAASTGMLFEPRRSEGGHHAHGRSRITGARRPRRGLWSFHRFPSVNEGDHVPNHLGGRVQCTPRAGEAYPDHRRCARSSICATGRSEPVFVAEVVCVACSADFSSRGTAGGCSSVVSILWTCSQIYRVRSVVGCSQPPVVTVSRCARSFSTKAPPEMPSY